MPDAGIDGTMNALYVAAGSALGGVCRYLFSLALNAPTGFPWGTFAVNVAGSLAIGVLSGWLAHGTAHAAAIRAFSVVGFCGGFTTFSTFSNEALGMLENSQGAMFAVYVAASVCSGVAGVWLGYLISR